VDLKNIDMRMSNKTAVSALVGLLLCLSGCSKPIDESRLVGEWKYPFRDAVLTLATNHGYREQEEDGRTKLGQWYVRGHYLMWVWTNTYTYASRSGYLVVTNGVSIAELTDSHLVLKGGLGEPAYTLTRIPAH